MSIYDFVYLLTEDSVTVAVWDITSESEIFLGEARDVSDGFGEYEIMSIDIMLPGMDKRGVSVVLNIEMEEE